MGSRRRLTKKQLKQDKFVTKTFELAQFVRENSQRVIVGAILTVAVVGGGLYYWDYRAHKELRAGHLVASGSAAYEAENYPLAISDLEKFTQDFSGTSLTDEALLMLADSYFKTGDYEMTRETLDRFVSRFHTSSPLSSQAYYLLGCAFENLKVFDKAAEVYQQAAEIARFDYQKSKLLIDAGRAFYEADEKDQAAEAYQNVIDQYPDSQEAGQARLRIAGIDATETAEVN